MRTGICLCALAASALVCGGAAAEPLRASAKAPLDTTALSDIIGSHGATLAQPGVASSQVALKTLNPANPHYIAAPTQGATVGMSLGAQATPADNPGAQLGMAAAQSGLNFGLRGF